MKVQAKDSRYPDNVCISKVVMVSSPEVISAPERELDGILVFIIVKSTLH